MSHPDPLHDYEDFDMDNDTNYDDYNDFYSEDAELNDHEDDFDDFDDYYDESMDGDHDSAMESAGWGTDEDYGFYGDDTPMFEDYYGGE